MYIKADKLFFFLFIILVFANCGKKKEAHTSKDINTKTRNENQNIFSEDSTDNISIQDEDFGIVKQYYHPNPNLLISEYLERDFKGEFLKQNEWFNTAMLRPLTVPAWDKATLIEKYDVDTVIINNNSASIKVTYYKIADILQNKNGPYLSFSKNIESKIFNLQLTTYGWRICPPSINPHVSYEYIKAIFSKNYQDSLNIYLSK